MFCYKVFIGILWYILRRLNFRHQMESTKTNKMQGKNHTSVLYVKNNLHIQEIYLRIRNTLESSVWKKSITESILLQKHTLVKNLTSVVFVTKGLLRLVACPNTGRHILVINPTSVVNATKVFTGQIFCLFLWKPTQGINHTRVTYVKEDLPRKSYYTHEYTYWQ